MSQRQRNGQRTVSCQSNAAGTQVRVIIKNDGENVEVQRLLVIEPADSVAKVILTHLLEDQAYDFKSTEIPQNAALTVTLQRTAQKHAGVPF